MFFTVRLIPNLIRSMYSIFKYTHIQGLTKVTFDANRGKYILGISISIYGKRYFHSDLTLRIDSLPLFPSLSFFNKESCGSSLFPFLVYVSSPCCTRLLLFYPRHLFSFISAISSFILFDSSSSHRSVSLFLPLEPRRRRATPRSRVPCYVIK